jgi:hypothetical protein
MFAYLAQFMGVQGATTFLCCSLTIIAQFVALYFGYKKFQREIRFSSYHQKQIEVLGELYSRLAISRNHAHFLASHKPDMSKDSEETTIYTRDGIVKIAELVAKNIELSANFIKYYESNWIYIPETIRESLIDFKDAIKNGMFKRLEELLNQEQLQQSKAEVNNFITTADNILYKIDQQIRKVIS